MLVAIMQRARSRSCNPSSHAIHLLGDWPSSQHPGQPIEARQGIEDRQAFLAIFRIAQGPGVPEIKMA
jgi:hypothetical protein